MPEENKLEFINKDINKIKIINTILIIIAIGLNIFAFFDEDVLITDRISFIITIIALVFGMVYTFKGYRKEDVKSFNLFMILCMMMLFLQLSGEIYYLVLYGTSILKEQLITIFSILLEVGMLSILTWVKNIGDKAATALVGIVLVFSTLFFIRTLVLYSGSKGYVALAFSEVVLACIMFMFIAGKYRNKALRGKE